MRLINYTVLTTDAISRQKKYGTMTVNYEVGETWKEASMAYLYIYRVSPEDAE